MSATLQGQDIEKSLLILVGPEFSQELTNSVCSFLEAQSWQVYITADIKVALRTLIERQPGFFVASLNHPAKRLSILLPLIATHLKICVIPMMENLSLGPNSNLEKNFKIVIRAPLTGMAIEKGIYRTLLQELQGDLLNIEDHNCQIIARDMGIESDLSAGVGKAVLRLPKVLPLFARSEELSPQEISKLLGHLDEDSSPVQTGSLGLGVERVLNEASIPGGANPEKLEIASQMSCITVNSNRFSGYLITAQANRKPVDQVFLSLVKNRLQQFLRDRGEAIEADDSMDLELKEVAFEDWAIECGEFLKKSMHSGQEIGMAFFPFTRAKIMYSPVNAEDLATVPIDDVNEDEVLPFDLYLFFPANGKYILYTPKGARFLSSQKSRLKKAGVQDLFVKQADVRSLDKYRAESHLNLQITEFQQRRSKV